MNFREVFRKRIEELKEFRDGTFLASLLKRLFEEHVKSTTAQFFRSKYPALDSERIAFRLIKNAAHAAGLSGAAAASAVTAAELGAVESAGATLAVAAASFASEISATTYIQLRMVCDIATVFDAPFDPNDPEDLITMFWYAFGVNKWEDAFNAAIKVGPRSAEYLGRKALRSGLRKALQNVAFKLGGAQLGRKITERALLKLIVPGINLPIAYLANVYFTKKLGKATIQHVKRRAAALRSLPALLASERKYQLTALALIYQIGIANEPIVGSSLVIEMQDILTRKLAIQDSEEPILENLIGMKFSEFNGLLRQVADGVCVDALSQIAHISCVMSADEGSQIRLEEALKCLGREIVPSLLQSLRKEMGI